MLHDSDATALALHRIAEEAAQRTGTLDLGGLGLDGLPDALFDLRHLRRLNLGHGTLDAAGEFERSFSSRENRVAPSLDRIGELPRLTDL